MRGQFNKKTLREVLHGLSQDTSPGLGGERNEHLTVLLSNEQREVASRAQSAFDNMFEFVNNAVQVNLPGYFYRAWVANRLVPANKVHPSELPEGAEPDYRPIQISRSDRRLFIRAYWDESLQFEYNRILGPVQNGVGIKDGISITAMGAETSRMGTTKSAENQSCQYSSLTHASLTQLCSSRPFLSPKGTLEWGTELS